MPVDLKVRTYLTEEEHARLVFAGDQFWEALGRNVAKVVDRFPPEIEELVLGYLQDKCSVYGSDFAKHLKKTRR